MQEVGGKERREKKGARSVHRSVGERGELTVGNTVKESTRSGRPSEKEREEKKEPKPPVFFRSTVGGKKVQGKPQSADSSS